MSRALFLPVLAALVILSGCEANEPASPVNKSEPKVDAGSNRYAFATEKDPVRGDVVKIFDQQTGDYWIKWVGTDAGSGSVYSVWNFFPLEGEPKSGLTQINTLKVTDPAKTGTPEKKPAVQAPANGADQPAKNQAPSKPAD